MWQTLQPLKPTGSIITPYCQHAQMQCLLFLQGGISTRGGGGKGSWSDLKRWERSLVSSHLGLLAAPHVGLHPLLWPIVRSRNDSVMSEAERWHKLPLLCMCQDWRVCAEHGDALWKPPLETPRPSSRAENQHSLDANWKSDTYSSLPDQWIWLLLGHQPLQGGDRFQDSPGMVVCRWWVVCVGGREGY